MDRILVYSPPEDRSGRAITLASELAHHLGARLLLLRVLEETPGWASHRDDESNQTQLRELLVEAESDELESLASPFRDRGLEITTRVAWGVAWEVITELVESEACSLVVKPARGLGRAGRVFFGSTALHLFRKCPCPVWVVGDEGRLPKKILAAIDPASDATRREVARRILGLARGVAGYARASLDVAAAWHAPGSRLLEGKIPKRELDEYVQDVRRRATEALEQIVEESLTAHPGDRLHVIEGQARDVLPRFAEKHEFDLIVMGTLGRTGVAGELLGETAEEIVRSVHCSVLTVAPPQPRSSIRETVES